jgi:hypothetical protein
VACLNNDKSVMSRPFAWRVLGILPILKASACTNTDKEWQRQRRLNMFHRAMEPMIAGINDLCKIPRYYRWADKMVSLGLAFWHIISLDGLEIAAAALSSTMECPTCECKSWTGQTSCILSEEHQMFVLMSRRRMHSS